jgi:biotin carboxyl carrier protein
MDMTHGTLATWHVAEGQMVQKGAALFDIETDKAAMEVEAPETGYLRRIAAQPGDKVAVGTTIAWLYAAGEADGAAQPAPARTLKAQAGPQPTEVILPKVDMDMTHGTLAVWHVAEGELVQQGAALFDIETDKAAMEVEAPPPGASITSSPNRAIRSQSGPSWLGFTQRARSLARHLRPPYRHPHSPNHQQSPFRHRHPARSPRPPPEGQRLPPEKQPVNFRCRSPT